MSRFDLVWAFVRLLAIESEAAAGMTASVAARRLGVSAATVDALFRVLDCTTYGRVDPAGERDGEEARAWRTNRPGPPLLRHLNPAERAACQVALGMAGDHPAAAVLSARLSGDGPPTARLIKGPPPLFADPVRLDLVQTWEGAVKARRRCRLTSRSLRGRRRTAELSPVGTVFLTGKGIWHFAYLASGTEVRTTPLDRVETVEPLPATYKLPAGFSLRSYFLHSWGIDQGPIFEICLRFSKTPPNVLTKILRETADRREASFDPQPDGSVIYRDRVAGLEEVRQWVRGYGRAVEVLAPPELREQMRTGLHRMLERIAEVDAEQES
ncbi:MAG TPA: WYL domain-containing protein [Symbiobacteriaceae bacterium]|nr:WYL domain-containing protein [Symbiobacteriaceae bacterium]